MRKLKQYALYKGDKYLYGGTKEEIAKYLNVSVKTIDHLLTPTYRKRRLKEGNNALELIKVEEGEDKE